MFCFLQIWGSFGEAAPLDSEMKNRDLKMGELWDLKVKDRVSSQLSFCLFKGMEGQLKLFSRTA